MLLGPRLYLLCLGGISETLIRGEQASQRGNSMCAFGYTLGFNVMIICVLGATG